MIFWSLKEGWISLYFIYYIKDKNPLRLANKTIRMPNYVVCSSSWAKHLKDTYRLCEQYANHLFEHNYIALKCPYSENMSKSKLYQKNEHWLNGFWIADITKSSLPRIYWNRKHCVKHWYRFSCFGTLLPMLEVTILPLTKKPTYVVLYNIALFFSSVIQIILHQIVVVLSYYLFAPAIYNIIW